MLSMPPATPVSRSPARTAASISADRADARRADLVDGLRGDLLRDAALDLRLARGDLALARLEHLADHDLLTCSGFDLGALERRGDRVAAQIGRVEACERAAQLAERRAGGAEDHGLWHVVEPRFCRDCRRFAAAAEGVTAEPILPPDARLLPPGRPAGHVDADTLCVGLFEDDEAPDGLDEALGGELGRADRIRRGEGIVQEDGDRCIPTARSAPRA